jgi:hypothetical protein
MQTATIEEVQASLLELLARQKDQGPLIITDGCDPIALLLRVPEGTDWDNLPSLNQILEPSASDGNSVAPSTAQPVFGSCKGMLTILPEDDEHLKDFDEYMR